MFQFKLGDPKYKKIHFIGVGGISMSGIAELLVHHGYDVSGSDREESKETNRLIALGVQVFIGQRKENIKSPDLVIYTDAILDDNEELIEARKLEVPVVSRGVFLGALMRNYEYSIAVSGSHGKSTVTSMIADVLMKSEKDPSILLGGAFDGIDGNVHCGNSEYMLTEACEYKGNILHYYPQMVIVLNIDEDHLDYFKDLNHIVDTFIGYMKNLDEDSKAIINIDDENCLKLLPHIKGQALTFGIENEKAKYNVKKVEFKPEGFVSFEIHEESLGVVPIELNILGRFNIYNATAAFIACYQAGVSVEEIVRFLSEYRNLHRRMEIVGYYNKATIMTDYGHHPLEIKSTLEALDEHKKERLICVFQPHTYSRTKRLMDEFAESFYHCDEVVVTEIYAAREKFDPTVHSVDLVEKLIAKGVNAKYYKTFEEAKNYIRQSVHEDDIVLTTGCGNPDVLARMIVQ